jgi:AraC family transcriptional regulator
MTGSSLKQYILGRKLTLAAESLVIPDYSVTRAALDFGFEYPEVFSRSFKKQFGVSPSEYRNEALAIQKVPKAFVVERDIMNIKGAFTVKDVCLHLDSKELYGVYTEVNEFHPDFEEVLNLMGGSFIKEYSQYFNDGKLYSVVNCHGNENGEYTVFFGADISVEARNNHLKPRTIPEGSYACFRYYGNMLDIRGTFVEDLYRWIMLKEIKLCSNGIGMINVYDVKDINDIRIYVPIVTE